MVLFILLWTWCIAVAFHPIHVTNGISQYVVWSEPKTVNFIATPISTVFVIITGQLFTQCVGLAMRKSMAQKLDARAFLRWNAIVNKHIIFRERPGWATLTLLSFVVLQSLTTGFTPNFTPQQIPLTKSQKTIEELDMSSDGFLNVYRPISPDVSCVGDLRCLSLSLTIALSSGSVSLWQLHFLFVFKIWAAEAADDFGGWRKLRIE